MSKKATVTTANLQKEYSIINDSSLSISNFSKSFLLNAFKATEKALEESTKRIEALQKKHFSFTPRENDIF
jgi:hypothetical protein